MLGAAKRPLVLYNNLRTNECFTQPGDSVDVRTLARVQNARGQEGADVVLDGLALREGHPALQHLPLLAGGRGGHDAPMETCAGKRAIALSMHTRRRQHTRGARVDPALRARAAPRSQSASVTSSSLRWPPSTMRIDASICAIVRTRRSCADPR